MKVSAASSGILSLRSLQVSFMFHSLITDGFQGREEERGEETFKILDIFHIVPKASHKGIKRSKLLYGFSGVSFRFPRWILSRFWLIHFLFPKMPHRGAGCGRHPLPSDY